MPLAPNMDATSLPLTMLIAIVTICVPPKMAVPFMMRRKEDCALLSDIGAAKGLKGERDGVEGLPTYQCCHIWETRIMHSRTSEPIDGLGMGDHEEVKKSLLVGSKHIFQIPFTGFHI